MRPARRAARATPRPAQATDLRTRQVGLALNYYPSFDADNLVTFKTKEVRVKPDALSLPPEAFDAAGEVKPEFWEVSTAVAYPEGHSVWSKLECPDAAERWRLADLKRWLQEAHPEEAKTEVLSPV